MPCRKFTRKCSLSDNRKFPSSWLLDEEKYTKIVYFTFVFFVFCFFRFHSKWIAAGAYTYISTGCQTHFITYLLVFGLTLLISGPLFGVWWIITGWFEFHAVDFRNTESSLLPQPSPPPPSSFFFSTSI